MVMTPGERIGCSEDAHVVARIAGRLRTLEVLHDDLSKSEAFQEAARAAARLSYLLEVLSCRIQRPVEEPAK